MSIASYIREIGRGKDGARSLTEAQAQLEIQQLIDEARATRRSDLLG